MFDVLQSLLPMTPQDTPSSDPLFGNAASDLLREAVGTDGKPPSDPRYWQPPTPEDLQSRLGGYVIEAFLARGGMGAVYRGTQTSLERAVAIKILPSLLSEHDANFALRFKQEARAMAQLNHPGIVKVFDFGEMSDGTLFFVMEFIDGTDVAQMVARQGRLSSAHALAVTAHVCDALQYAHELGIVHRDIKPANIMVGIDGQVKVADFGLAKSFQSGNTSLTITGHVMGTLHFVAPEALTLGSSVDHRADIYATGVMLYQMLTGRLPQGIFELPSLLVPGLDPRYDPIIANAMREDREVRYQAILEMRHALNAILTKPVQRSEVAKQNITPTSAPQAATPPKPQPGQQYYRPPQAQNAAPPLRQKSNTTTWLLAAAVVLALGGIAWMNMGNSAPPLPVTDSTAEAPDSAKPNPMGPIGDLVFPTVQFNGATISECVEYFQIKSRDLDPNKKGITFLVDEATRNSTVIIDLDLKDIRVADFIECFARFARLEVSYVGDAVRLKASPSVKPPFPIGTPTPKLQQLGKNIFPIMHFEKATLEEACEYVRVKQRDFSGQHLNLVIDADFTQRKHEITMDLTQVPLSDGLTYITEMCDAEVTYLADAIYIQPRSSSTAKLPLTIGAPTSKLQQLGKTIFPTVSFQNATLAEACEYVRIKGREISGQPVNLIIDPDLSLQKHEISIDAHRVSLSTALSYIAELSEAEVAYIAEAFYLRPRSANPVQADPNANQPGGEAGKVVFPIVRFQNATIGEAVEYLRVKSRDLDPQKKGMVILLDDAAIRAAGTITLDSQNITGANALAQIASVAGVEIYRVGEATRLRAPATTMKPTETAPKPESPPPSVSVPPAPSKTEPEYRTFTNSKGQSIRAILLMVADDSAVLKLENGQRHTIKAATLSVADIEYLKTKGLVMPQPPAVAAAKAPAPKPAPVAPVETPKMVPAPSAATTYGSMEFSPNWLPQTLTAKRELLESLEFYCKAAIGNAPKGQEPIPGTIVGGIRWRMPIDQAVQTLPRGFNKIMERPMVHPCLPNDSLILCGFQFKSFVDHGQPFNQLFLLVDKERKVVSVQFVDQNGKNARWLPEPDGIREPYFNLVSLTHNGSSGKEVPYQILRGSSSAVCIKTAFQDRTGRMPNMPKLPTNIPNMPTMMPSMTSGSRIYENVHWYIPAPFARSILDIVEVYRKAGVIQ